jgi:signal peptidase II
MLSGLSRDLYDTEIMIWTANKRMAAIAVAILAFDQLTKLLVLHLLGYAQERVIIDGFFKFVHWGNTGAAWSLFRDQNDLLAIVSLGALLLLFLTRRHFDSGTVLGQVALGLLFGGIVGNLVDRLLPSRRHVIDFIYFYLYQRGGREIGFPAFNVADSAICIGVGLLFIISWKQEHTRGTSRTASVSPSPNRGQPVSGEQNG